MPIKQQLMGALVALPLPLAFGVASGLGAEAGVLALGDVQAQLNFMVFCRR